MYLQRRGQKFWSLRYQSFVAYEGRDFQVEQYYVRGIRCFHEDLPLLTLVLE